MPALDRHHALPVVCLRATSSTSALPPRPATLTDDYELVFVNDGSPDDSLERVLRLVERDERVRVVDLSRNFGHHRAMMTGLAQSRGELVFLIDSDLEEDPELLATFTQELAERDVDVVYGVQESGRADSASGSPGASSMRPSISWPTSSCRVTCSWRG